MSLSSLFAAILEFKFRCYAFILVVSVLALFVVVFEFGLRRELNFTNHNNSYAKTAAMKTIDSALSNIFLIVFENYYCSLVEKLPLVQACGIKVDLFEGKLDVQVSFYEPLYHIMLSDSLYAVDDEGRLVLTGTQKFKHSYLFFVDENSFNEYFPYLHNIMKGLIARLGEFCHGLVSSNLVRIKFCGYPSVTFYSVDLRDLESSFIAFQERILPRFHKVRSAREIQINFDGSASVLVE